MRDWELNAKVFSVLHPQEAESLEWVRFASGRDKMAPPVMTYKPAGKSGYRCPPNYAEDILAWIELPEHVDSWQVTQHDGQITVMIEIGDDYQFNSERIAQDSDWQKTLAHLLSITITDW